jgi:hypothetical protein
MLDALAAGFRECKLKPLVGPKLQLDAFLDGMLRSRISRRCPLRMHALALWTISSLSALGMMRMRGHGKYHNAPAYGLCKISCPGKVACVWMTCLFRSWDGVPGRVMAEQHIHLAHRRPGYIGIICTDLSLPDAIAFAAQRTKQVWATADPKASVQQRCLQLLSPHCNKVLQLLVGLPWEEGALVLPIPSSLSPGATQMAIVQPASMMQVCVLTLLGHPMQVCTETFGAAPDVIIHQGDGSAENLTMPYVDSHLDYMLFELLKNAMRAVVVAAPASRSRQNRRGGLPPVHVRICKAPSSVTLRISDQVWPHGGVSSYLTCCCTCARRPEAAPLALAPGVLPARACCLRC